MKEDFDENQLIEDLKQQIADNPIILYMKGTPSMPQCGFSYQAVQALRGCEQKFAFVNVLDHPEVRATLPKVNNWPTFPQLYVNGELVGGCDIICEMYEDGELQQLVKEAV
jgi:monothiol glutaredoxin